MTIDPDHKAKVEARIQALVELAKRSENTFICTKGTRTRSSLHQFIKTKEQADRFMAALRRPGNK